MISKRRRRARLAELVHLTSVLANSMGLEKKVTGHLQLLQVVCVCCVCVLCVFVCVRERERETESHTERAYVQTRE